MIVHVAIPAPITRIFSYSLPEIWEQSIRAYMRVRVPFRNRVVTGVILGIEERDDGSLKGVQEVVDIFPMLDDSMADLCGWASEHYVTPPGIVLKYSLPGNLRIDRYLILHATGETDSCLEGLTLHAAAQELGKPELAGLYREKKIIFFNSFTGKPLLESGGTRAGSPVHERVIYTGRIQDRLTFYEGLIAPRLEAGENVLMLLPDYYATGRFFYEHFRKAFPGRVFWYGTSVKRKEAVKAYLHARSRQGCLVMGNKSCVFLPVTGNSLIIAERYEDDGFRNEEGFKFNAARLAVKRGEIEKTMIVLGGAAPSAEAYMWVKDGVFTHIREDSSWFQKKRVYKILPKRESSRQGYLPPEIVTLTRNTVERGGRVAIFTPRKDHASRLQCVQCGQIVTCDVCGDPVIYRKNEMTLYCFRCGKQLPYSEKCKYCRSPLVLFSRAGAEQIEGFLRRDLGKVRIVKVTSDSLRKIDQETEQVIREETPLVIVGTGVLSKLYGVGVDILILYGWGDLIRMAGYRAREKAYQVLRNLLDVLTPERTYVVSDGGRRMEIPNIEDMEQFYEKELEARQSAQFPPFTRIFMIEVKRHTGPAGERTVKKIQDTLAETGLQDSVTGPIHEKRDTYRWRMIVRVKDDVAAGKLLSLYDIPGVHLEPDPTDI